MSSPSENLNDAAQSQSQASQMDPATVKLCIGIVCGPANDLLLKTCDVITDTAAQAAGHEIDEIHTSDVQRKALDKALAVVLEYYLGTIMGPALAYLLVVSTTLATRYSFSPLDSEGSENEKQGKPDPDHGKTRPRKNNPAQEAVATGDTKQRRFRRKKDAAVTIDQVV